MISPQAHYGQGRLLAPVGEQERDRVGGYRLPQDRQGRQPARFRRGAARHDERHRENRHDAVVYTRLPAWHFQPLHHPSSSSPCLPAPIASPTARLRAGGATLPISAGSISTTPNSEARPLGDQDSGIRPLASNLYDAARCKLLILKLGERGVLACRSRDHESLDSFLVIDSFVDRLVDAVGAGDALLAYSTLAMLADDSDAVATILGSMAAAVECELDGNIPVSRDDLTAKIDSIERQLAYA